MNQDLKKVSKLTAHSLQLKASSRGQMLLEAMVAMGILTVAVFAIFSMLTRSTSLNRTISQQYVATYLAAEGLELAKNITDSNLLACGTNWRTGATNGTWEVDYTDSEFRNVTGRPLKINSSNGLYQYATGDDSIFKRTVDIRAIDADNDGDLEEEIRVISTVTWRSRGGVDNEVQLEDHFFKWRPLPAGC